MEILIRVVDGKVQIQVGGQASLVEAVGVLELAKAQLLRQATAPPPAIAIPTPGAVSRLVGG